MMKKQIRLALAQINCTVGDIASNCAKIADRASRAEKNGACLVVFPELAVTGYPPEDLLLKEHFIKRNIEALKTVAARIGDIVAVVGFADTRRGRVYNAAAVIHKGRVHAVYHKIMLPNYGVFDEVRYFAQGSKPLIFNVNGAACGVNICEDIWRGNGPLKHQAKAGAGLIVTLNSSPYHIGKIGEREAVIKKAARSNRVSIAYANLVGGQDELVFDGCSMIVDDKGRIIARAAAFEEELLVCDMSLSVRAKKGAISLNTGRKSAAAPVRNTLKALPGNSEEAYRALVLGLKDYVTKNGFAKVAVGLSGGIDSALVAVLAADAIGAGNVTGVFMPSRYSSKDSAEDAQELAKNMKIRYEVISIEKAFDAYLETLGPLFKGTKPDIAEENLQARIRGNLLMALSNKFGWLVLTTGNKSEMSTGYATLYGDMAGGFAVIKDVPKTLVYDICKFINSKRELIPQRIMTKEPTAELKSGQKDSDTLPPYDVLDPILKAYIEDDTDAAKLIARGCAKNDVLRVIGMVDKSEYKRRQSPPGIRITPKAFGRDRRMPITNRYKEY
jgi:NAD+ synthase (glutamine-hydrolysing)